MTEPVIIPVCGLAELAIQPDYPWLQELVSGLGDVGRLYGYPNRGSVLADARERVLVQSGSIVRTPEMRELAKGVLVRPSAMLDLRYGVWVLRSSENELTLQTDRPCLEWVMWALQLALLRGGATFVHAAGVEKDGTALLFPSWGGVGKTAIVRHLVGEFGWRLLGDDLVVLSRDGMCFGFPKPLVIYPHHRAVFPDVFARGSGPVACTWMNAALTRAAQVMKPLLRPAPRLLQLARRHNPQSVRIAPSEVFGRDRLAMAGHLKEVVWLDRVEGLSAPQFTPCELDLTSALMGSTLFENDPWCVRLTNVARGLGILSCGQLYANWVTVLQGALALARRWQLYLPAGMPLPQTVTAVHTLLLQNGLC